MSKLFLVTGAALIAIGLLLYLFPAAFDWFGRLPGDIRIENAGSRFYFPLTSMVIVSIIISIIINIFSRL